MLTKEENELICRVGPGTPMGGVLRRYWLPVCLAEEVAEPDGPPVAARLAGEDLVVFRDSDGRIGLLDEHCPHRGASLAIGQNGLGGLSCLYHGWKYDVSGRCLEMPTEPEDTPYREKVRAVSYPVREAGGLLWTYLGPQELTPSFPNFEFIAVSSPNRAAAKLIGNANFVQAIEGGIDSAHAPILHKSEIKPTPGSPYPSMDTRPSLEMEDTEYGFRYAAIRKTLEDPENKFFVRITEFIAPFYAQVAPRLMQIFVPVDDYHTASYLILYDPVRPVDADFLRTMQGLRLGIDLDAAYRPFRQRGNKWLQDREAMRSGESWTGVHGILMQDNLVQESMGPIQDRTREHLASADMAVIQMRRVLLDCVRRVQDGGAPAGLESDLQKAIGAVGIIERGQPWQSLLEKDGEGSSGRFQIFERR